MKRLSIALLAALLAVDPAFAVTKTVTWVWPTTRIDGSTLALSAIGGFSLWDVSVPVPGQPGTLVACPTTIPPTTANGTCTANVTSGHSFQATYVDTASPPDVSPSSNTVIVPQATPSPITTLSIQ